MTTVGGMLGVGGGSFLNGTPATTMSLCNPTAIAVDAGG